MHHKLLCWARKEAKMVACIFQKQGIQILLCAYYYSYYFIIITYNAFNVYIYFYIIFMRQLEDISLFSYSKIRV